MQRPAFGDRNDAVAYPDHKPSAVVSEDEDPPLRAPLWTRRTIHAEDGSGVKTFADEKIAVEVA